ncbi:MAG: hypothetical protein U0670_20010 [Anaerolineae bacterium]
MPIWTGYETNAPESTPSPQVSRGLWRLTMAMLAAVLVGGIGLAVILSLGAADPLRTNLTNLDHSPAGSVHAPFTLETSAPGFDLMCSDAPTLQIRVRRDGYFSISTGHDDWQEFLHIRLSPNRLSLYADESGMAVLRINDEIAWRGSLPSGSCQYRTVSVS